jgi:hypothetical protein
LTAGTDKYGLVKETTMRFKEFLQKINEGPAMSQTIRDSDLPHGFVQPKSVDEPKVLGRSLMKLISKSTLSNADQASMESALAGYMNSELTASDISRLARKARVDINSILQFAKLDESEQQKYHDFHEWMQACKDAHPDFAKEMRFKIDGDDHVAYVRGLDRIFGVWKGDDDGEGVILEGKMKDAGYDLVDEAIKKMPRQPGMSTRQYVLDLVDVVLQLDRESLFRGDREVVEQFIKTYLGL